eukprot:SRR837773.1524.p2 GENE.SRR837773.1524~~SRR837773.1524.p2  ORF type:complete len:141 (+),score=22.80 SRR837773.1524:30-425(+)
MFPRKVSWNVVRSKTQVEVNAAVSSGAADALNGVKAAGPIGRSSLIVNTIDGLGGYTKYTGRTFITEFDWEGCRPLSKTGVVVVPKRWPVPAAMQRRQPFKGSRIQRDAVQAAHMVIAGGSGHRALRRSIL